MVKKLSQDDEATIRDAIGKAERRTNARLSVVVLPFSDRYQDFVLLYGFVIGTAASLALWSCGYMIYPWLLLVQFGAILLVDIVPWLRRLCVRLVPQRVRHSRAKNIAHREYLVLHAEVPKDEPFVLLFVSLAEHYVHVVTNPAVHKKIPESWDIVTNRFIGLIRKEGLRAACVQGVEHIAEILGPHFPRK